MRFAFSTVSCVFICLSDIACFFCCQRSTLYVLLSILALSSRPPILLFVNVKMMMSFFFLVCLLAYSCPTVYRRPFGGEIGNGDGGSRWLCCIVVVYFFFCEAEKRDACISMHMLSTRPPGRKFPKWETTETAKVLDESYRTKFLYYINTNAQVYISKRKCRWKGCIYATHDSSICKH
jgi:hypothetical protein